MAADPALTGRLDRLIELFNLRGLDLPEGLFDRRTQFLLNGAPFETLLGQPPTDPLVLMLSRGPAGYRFSVKALQHAMPDAHVQRGEIAAEDGHVSCQLWLSGTLRGTGEAIEALVAVALTMAADGHVAVAAATLDDRSLDLIRAARLRD